jgi:hypothetical protein
VVDTYQEPFSWTWSQEPWIQSELDHLVNFSDQTTLSSVNPELVTTGPKGITRRVQNSSTQFWTLFVRKLRDVIASRDSRSLTPWEEVLDQAWELYLSQR